MSMLSCVALSALCTTVSPHLSFTSRSPRVPSWPLPESRMQAAFSPQASASERKRRRSARAARSMTGPLHSKLAVHHGELGARRNDVHIVELDRHPILGFDHGHRGATAEQLCKHTLVIGREVLDRDKGQAVSGGTPQELLEYVEAAGRPADANDRADLRSAFAGLHLSRATRLRTACRSPLHLKRGR